MSWNISDVRCNAGIATLGSTCAFYRLENFDKIGLYIYVGFSNYDSAILPNKSLRCTLFTVTLVELRSCAGKPSELRYSERMLSELRSFAVKLPELRCFPARP